jgi:hypothetical protein
MSCCKVEVLEEVGDDLVCADLLEWRADVSFRVWQENDQGELVINEDARRDEIAKRAYQRWEEFGTDEVTNWLEAEIDVDLALFD